MGQRLSRSKNKERHATPLDEARQTGRTLEESQDIEESATQQSNRIQTEPNTERGDYTKPHGRIQTEHNTENENATAPTEVASGGNK